MTVTRNRKPAGGAEKIQASSSAKSAQAGDETTAGHGGGASRTPKQKASASLAATKLAHKLSGSRGGAKGEHGSKGGAQRTRSTSVRKKGDRAEQDLLGGLPSERRPALERTLRQIAELLSEPTSEKTVSQPAFEVRAQIAVDTLRVITLGGSRQLQSLIEALEPVTPEDPEVIDKAEAEARGRLRLQALYQKIVADSYTVADLREQWNISRQRLAQLRGEDRLFAVSVPYHRGFLYPRWQFGADQRPRPIMANLIQEAKRAGLDAIDFHQLMNNSASGAGIPPVEMLDHGQEELVLGIIRATEG
jgi:hypothetical protein